MLQRACSALLLLAAVASAVEPLSCVTSPQAFLEKVVKASGYNKYLHPDADRNEPTTVEMQLQLLHVSAVNAKTASIQVNGYLRNWWKDDRLAYNESCSAGPIILRGLSEGEVWTPDVYMTTVASLADVPDELAAKKFTRVEPDGSLYRSQYQLAHMQQKFNLGKMPFDNSTCAVIWASMKQDNTKLVFATHKNSDGTEAGLQAEGLRSVSWTYADKLGGTSVDFTAPGLTVFDAEGGYGYAAFAVYWDMARRPGYFQRQVIFINSIFMVLGWIQFWVQPAKTNARAGLATMPILIIRTMSNAVYGSIPQTSKGVWLEDLLTYTMFLCIAAALDFAVIQWFRFREEQCKHQQEECLKALKDLTTMDQLKEAIASTAVAPRGGSDMELSKIPSGTRKGGLDEPLQPGAGAGEQTTRETHLQLATSVKFARDMFELVAGAGGGKVDAEQLRVLLRSFGVYLNLDDVKTALRSKDQLDFAEFLDFLKKADEFNKILLLKREFNGRTFLNYVNPMRIAHLRPSAAWNLLGRILYPVSVCMVYLYMWIALRLWY